MKKALKVLAITFASIIFIIIVGIIALDKLFSSGCGNTIFQEVVSPKKDIKAVLFQRDCGATTGFSTQISIIPVGHDLPNDGGNIYIINGHPDNRNIKVAWESSKELKIGNTSGIESFKKETIYRGVSIKYE